MFTLRPTNSDSSGEDDTRDPDADGDEICNSGLVDDSDCDSTDVVPPSQEEKANVCPPNLYDPEHHRTAKLSDHRYWDWDDNGNGIPDECDSNGRLVSDPNFGDGVHATVIPVKLAIKEMIFNLDISLDDDLHIKIKPVPGFNLVEAFPVNQYPIEFECDRGFSHVFQGGKFGQCDDVGGCAGQNISTAPQCEGLSEANQTADKFELMDRGLQGTSKQLECTVDAMLRCSVPIRMAEVMDRLTEESFASTSQEVMDQRFHFDFYYPIKESKIAIDSQGIGVSGPIAILPAGTSTADDTDKRSAKNFLTSFPEKLRQKCEEDGGSASACQAMKDNFPYFKFGPVVEAQVPKEDRIDPVAASKAMGSELGFALSEEFINEFLFALNVNLFDLDRREPDGTKKTLDMTTARIRELGLAIPDIGGDMKCKDENGNEINNDDWHCVLPGLSLNLGNVLGPDTLDYVKLSLDEVTWNQATQSSLTSSDVPAYLRTILNPLLSPSVHLKNVSGLEAFDGTQVTRPQSISAEIELDLPPTKLAVYQEQLVNNNATPKVGNGHIVDWCLHFPGMDPKRCGGSGNGQLSPIVVFSMSGKISLSIKVVRGDNGILRVYAGLSSKGDPNVVNYRKLDTERTWLKIHTVENNTIVPDKVLSEKFAGQLDIILGNYLFATPREIQFKLPSALPLDHVCQGQWAGELKEVCDCLTDSSGSGCEIVSKVQTLWEDLDLEKYGVTGLLVEDPIFNFVGSSVYTSDPTQLDQNYKAAPRYLSLGTGLCLTDSQGKCIGGNSQFDGFVQQVFGQQGGGQNNLQNKVLPPAAEGNNPNINNPNIGNSSPGSLWNTLNNLNQNFLPNSVNNLNLNNNIQNNLH